MCFIEILNWKLFKFNLFDENQMENYIVNYQRKWDYFELSLLKFYTEKLLKKMGGALQMAKLSGLWK